MISWGPAANLAEQAANELSRTGTEAAVIDLRWLTPLDVESLLLTVEQADGRALVVHEANLTGGFGAEVMARLMENGFHEVRRIGAPDVRIPASSVLQKALLPGVETIVAAVSKMLDRRTRPAPRSAEKSSEMLP